MFCCEMVFPLLSVLFLSRRRLRGAFSASAIWLLKHTDEKDSERTLALAVLLQPGPRLKNPTLIIQDLFQLLVKCGFCIYIRADIKIYYCTWNKDTGSEKTAGDLQ